MDKKLKSLLVTVLSVVLLLSLAACGSDKSSDLDKMAKSNAPIYLSEMLEAGGTRIWYEIADTYPGKDSIIYQAFVFENGEVTVYTQEIIQDSGFQTLGDVSRLTDEKTLDLLYQNYVLVNTQKEETLKEKFFASYDTMPITGTSEMEEIIYNSLIAAYDVHPDEYLVQLEELIFWSDIPVLEELLEEDFYELVDLMYNVPRREEEDEMLRRTATARAEAESLARRTVSTIAEESEAHVDANEVESYRSKQEEHQPLSHPYELNVITDSTGNNTVTEKIIYLYDVYSAPGSFNTSDFYDTITRSVINFLVDVSINDEAYTSEEGSIELYEYYEGVVYDTIFGGFRYLNRDGMLVTELSESLTGVNAPPSEQRVFLDPPTAAGVTVD